MLTFYDCFPAVACSQCVFGFLLCPTHSQQHISVKLQQNIYFLVFEAQNLLNSLTTAYQRKALVCHCNRLIHSKYHHLLEIYSICVRFKVALTPADSGELKLFCHGMWGLRCIMDGCKECHDSWFKWFTTTVFIISCLIVFFIQRTICIPVR